MNRKVRKVKDLIKEINRFSTSGQHLRSVTLVIEKDRRRGILMSKFAIDMWFYIVRLLPRHVLYFSYLHILAHATTGKYGDTNTAEIPAIEALKRWSDDERD